MWREDPSAEGGYVAAYAGNARPSGDEIDELLAPPEDPSAGGGDALSGLGKFIKGFQAM